MTEICVPRFAGGTLPPAVRSGQTAHTVRTGNRCGSLYHSPDHQALCPVLHRWLCQDSGSATRSTRNLPPRISCSSFCQHRLPPMPRCLYMVDGRTREALDAEWPSRKFLSGVGMAARPWRYASTLGCRTIAKSGSSSGWIVARCPWACVLVNDASGRMGQGPRQAAIWMPYRKADACPCHLRILRLSARVGVQPYCRSSLPL